MLFICSFMILLFQSTPSVGRTTINASMLVWLIVYFNPRPPWGGRHSLTDFSKEKEDFNPRPPWGGRQAYTFQARAVDKVFQSTPSVGRTTLNIRVRRNASTLFQSTPSVGRTTNAEFAEIIAKYISIHALRGEDDQVPNKLLKSTNISIHALRGEDDSKRFGNNRRVELFQSTPSVGRTT